MACTTTSTGCNWGIVSGSWNITSTPFPRHDKYRIQLPVGRLNNRHNMLEKIKQGVERLFKYIGTWIGNEYGIIYITYYTWVN